MLLFQRSITLMMETRNNSLRLKQWDYVWKNTPNYAAQSLVDTKKYRLYLCWYEAGFGHNSWFSWQFVSSFFLFFPALPEPFGCSLNSSPCWRSLNTLKGSTYDLSSCSTISASVITIKLTISLQHYGIDNFMPFFILPSGITEETRCLPLILTQLVSMCVI